MILGLSPPHTIDSRLPLSLSAGLNQRTPDTVHMKEAMNIHQLDQELLRRLVRGIRHCNYLPTVHNKNVPILKYWGLNENERNRQRDRNTRQNGGISLGGLEVTGIYADCRQTICFRPKYYEFTPHFPCKRSSVPKMRWPSIPHLPR